MALCLAVNKKGKVKWRGAVVSVTVHCQCASKINECNFKIPFFIIRSKRL